jgi:hypothetical protein
VSEPGAVATGSSQKPARQQSRLVGTPFWSGFRHARDQQKELDRIYMIYRFERMHAHQLVSLSC